MSKYSSFLPKIDILDSFKRAVSIKKQKPWESVTDFATHPSFCGNKLYPRQQTLLKLVYLETEQMTQYDKDVIGEWSESFSNVAYPIGVQQDIWERVDYLKANSYDHFRFIEGVMGRRASKGHMGGIFFCERMASLIALDDPQDYFGIAAYHDIYALIVATTGAQAQKFLFADLLSQVRKNKWLQPYVEDAADHQILLKTPADIRATADLMAKGIPPRKPITSIKAIPVSSNSGSNRGGAVIAAGFDEFAFTLGGDSNRSGTSMYAAIEPSLDQFGKEALLYMPSSPWSKIGKFWELYQNGSVLMDEYLAKQGKLVTKKSKDELEAEIITDAKEVLANPEMLIVQLESWGLYQDYEKSPLLLSSPNKSYRKRKSISDTSEITGADGKKIAIVGKNALELSDSIKVDNMIIHIEDISSPEVLSENLKTYNMSEIEVVYPGHEFKMPIQVKPDPNGTVQQKAMAAMESRDKTLFRVERRGQFLAVQDAYLTTDEISGMFSTFWNGRKLKQTKAGIPKWNYYLHADPSKVNADFAVMIAHTEPAPVPDTDGQYYDHMIVDYYHVYQPHNFDKGEIDYLLVIEDLKQIVRAFPTMRSLTMDQFNSVMPLQTLKKYVQALGRNLSVYEQTFTGKFNQDMYKAMKTALSLGWVHSPSDSYFKDGKGCLLEQEMAFLQANNGRVVKGSNKDVTHDDLVDCLGVLITKLLGSQLALTNEQLENLSLVPGTAVDENPGFKLIDNSQFLSSAQKLDSLY